ncbi:MAG: methionine--tRNA ligase [Verrucomicrobiota bacterium]
MPKDTYYITTAIDYTNAPPHIGHAYEKVLADCIARYQRLGGKKVYFLTGVDQHGQKVQQTAATAGINPATHVAKITKKFKALWEALNLDYDGWAETTDDVHKRVVKAILRKLHDDGQIHKATYSGFYSVKEEQYITEKERNEDGTWEAKWGEVVELEEENYYFKLSEHLPWLLEFLKTNPDRVYPDFRLSQLVNAVEAAAGSDLCISRPKERLTWGIEIPFDSDFVTYVWFDALTNYISFAGYLDESGELPDFESLWPCDAHVIGKEILVPAHGVYWLCMLHALGFPDEHIPRLLVHGWWNIKGEKMSKTFGNIVDPHELMEKVGADGLRYYLMSDISTGQDSDFSDERLLFRFNQDLANDLGNLLNRTLNMIKRYQGGALSGFTHEDELNSNLRSQVEALPDKYMKEMEYFQVSKALAAVWEIISACNAYVDQCAPWALAKDEANADRLASVLYHLAETLAHISIYISPVIPNAAEKIRHQLRFELKEGFTLENVTWGMLSTGHETGKAKPLFPRLETDESKKNP